MRNEGKCVRERGDGIILFGIIIDIHFSGTGLVPIG